MKKVDEVYPIDINSTIGPTGTIKRLFRNRDYFRKRGYDMSILACHPIGKKLLTYKYELKEIATLPGESNSNIMPDTINSSERRSSIKAKLKKIVESNKWIASWRYNSILKKKRSLIIDYINMRRKPDIIVFHEIDSCYHYHQLMGDKVTHTVLFIHADGSDDTMFKKSHPKLIGSSVHKKVVDRMRYAVEHCTRVVFISQRAKRIFCNNHPEINPNKVIAFVNGIDNKPLIKVKPSSSYIFRLCTTGSVCERKGQYIIVEAMRRMKPEILQNTHLTIMGVGEDYSKLKEQVIEYGLTEHVSLPGNIPNEQIHERLSSENIYVLMSNNEGLPISIIEAMRAGLPIISTTVAGIPEEVDERNGVLINPDITELTDILNRLPEYDWELLGKQSRCRFENEFTFDIMMKNYADIFETIE